MWKMELYGYFGYEAGQSCVGDHFAWLTENFLSASYEKAANEQGIHIYEYLNKLAAKKKSGGNGTSGIGLVEWKQKCSGRWKPVRNDAGDLH